MTETQFTYCEGQACIRKEECPQYIEGKKIGTRTEGFWWQSSCPDRIPPVKEFVKKMGMLSRIAYYLGVIRIKPTERTVALYATAERRVRWWNPLTFLLFLICVIPVLIIASAVASAIAVAVIGDSLFFSKINIKVSN